MTTCARKLSVLILATTLLTVWGKTAEAVVAIDGFVKTGSGIPIVDADLDWYNRDLDQDIDPTGDHTNGSGYYSVVIPEGRYDITVIGPASNLYAPVFLEDVDLQISQTLADINLPDGRMVTAHVETTDGAPLNAIRFTFENVDTGDPAFLLNSRSDSFGDFSAVIPLGTYDVLLTDSSDTYAPACFELVVDGVEALGDIALGVGRVVTGVVVDGGGSGIFNVDLDVVDEVTGADVCTFSDNTDLFGNYELFIPDGLYEFQFIPAPGSPFAPERMRDVEISGATVIPTMTLLPALTVTGVVRTAQGTPISGADVDVFDAVTGEKRLTPGDNTDAGGNFSVVVPAGTYDFAFNPPDNLDLASAVRWDVAISSSTSLGIIELEAGVVVSGTVRGSGTPLADVDLDFLVVANGKIYPTPADDTDVAGFYRVRIPTGVYDVTATPPAGSGFDPKTETGQNIATDTVLDFDLDAAVAVGDVGAGIGVRLRMAPNPFRGAVRIQLDTPAGSRTDGRSVAIYGPTGRRVRDLATGIDPTGVVWDGRDDGGRAVPPGVYFVRAELGEWSQTSRITRVR